MRYFFPNGQEADPNRQFSLGAGEEEITYPAGWLLLSTEADREALGITTQPDIVISPTQAELDAQWNANIDAQIFSLESGSIWNRYLREKELAAAIAEAQKTYGVSDPAVIAAASPGFAKLYALDQQISALRHQRK